MAVGIFTILAGLVALVAAYFYLFGISPETKRKMEKKALETMGENKMSYVAKDQINKIPTSDQEDVKQLKKGISNLAGGAMQNPLGEQAVRAATKVWDYSKEQFEQVDWPDVQAYSRSALDRVATITGKTVENLNQRNEEKVDESEVIICNLAECESDEFKRQSYR